MNKVMKNLLEFIKDSKESFKESISQNSNKDLIGLPPILFNADEKLVYGSERPMESMKRLLYLYDNANSIKQFKEITDLENRLNIANSKFILIEDISDTGDVFTELRLMYLNNIISKKIIMVMVNSNELEKIMEFYMKGNESMFPAKILVKKQNKYSFESFDNLEEYPV